MTDTSTRFKPGQSGNPGGKVKGQRRVLTADFIRAIAKDFHEHGPAVIEQVRMSKPEKYLEIVARLCPVEVTGEDGEPINVRDVALPEVARRIAFVLAAGAAPSQQQQQQSED